MIICCYDGIGKSYLAHNYQQVIDLESTPFEKDWDRYAKCAIHYHKQGYLVLVSCHREIREKICDSRQGVSFGDRLTIVPNLEDKIEYLKRYLDRGNTDDFIKIQMDNWDKWLNEEENRILNEQWVVMEKGETLYDCLIRLSKKEPHFFCNYDQCPCPFDCKKMNCVNPLCEIVNKWQSTIITATLEQVIQKENEINDQIELLKEQRASLYDELVNQQYKKGDLIIYENEVNEKAVFDHVENGKVFARYLASTEVCCINSSKGVYYHWKKN